MGTELDRDAHAHGLEQRQHRPKSTRMGKKHSDTGHEHRPGTWETWSMDQIKHQSIRASGIKHPTSSIKHEHGGMSMSMSMK
jgi:hypothetical protein